MAMEIIIKSKDKNSIVFELPTEDHTFSNLLKSVLHKMDKVEAAAYRIEHPLRGNPEVLVKTKGVGVKKVLTDAASEIIKQAEEFERAFNSASKK